MRTNKFIPFLIALFLHLGPIAFFLLQNHFKVSNSIAQVRNPGIHGIGLSTFTFAGRNIRQPRNLTISQSSLPSRPSIVDDGSASSSTNVTVGSVGGIGQNSNKLPSFLAYQEPIYPTVARMKGYVGKVKIKAYYDSEGVITKVDVVESSGVSMLDESVRKSAFNWRVAKGVSGDFEKSFEFNLRN